MKKKILSYEPYIFNPWQRVPVTCPSTVTVGVGQMNSLVGAIDEGGVLELADEPTWNQPLRWNKKLAKKGLIGTVLMGPSCDWSDQDILSATQLRLWEIISNELYLDWWLLSKRTTSIVQSLPYGWRGGYENVALGLLVEHRDDMQEVENLKKIRTKSRFLEVSESLEAVVELDLKGVDFVTVRVPNASSADSSWGIWFQKLRSHCNAEKTELRKIHI